MNPRILNLIDLSERCAKQAADMLAQEAKETDNVALAAARNCEAAACCLMHGDYQRAIELLHRADYITHHPAGEIMHAALTKVAQAMADTYGDMRRSASLLRG